MSRLFFTFVTFSALLVEAAGVVVTLFAVRSMLRQARVSRWPTVSGVVVAANLHEEKSEGATLFRPVVSYRYQVGDRSYESQRFSWVELETSDRDRAAEALTGLTPGASVTVTYDPVDPASAVISNSNRMISQWILILGLGLMVFAGTVALAVQHLAGHF